MAADWLQITQEEASAEEIPEPVVLSIEPTNVILEACQSIIVAGENFLNAVSTFENFDVDGDRHIQIDELASALEAMGE